MSSEFTPAAAPGASSFSTGPGALSAEPAVLREDDGFSCDHQGSGALEAFGTSAVLARAHSFRSEHDEAQPLYSMTFRLSRVGLPSGNLVAKLYLAAGTHGTDAVPTGSPLAVSEPIAVGDLSAGGVLDEVEFVFVNGPTIRTYTTYCAVVELVGFTPGAPENYVVAGLGDDPPGHAGNASQLEPGGWVSGEPDMVFCVKTVTSYSSYGGCPDDPDDNGFMSCPTVPGGTFEPGDPFPKRLLSEVSRVVGRASVAKIERRVEVVVREFMDSAEAADGSQVGAEEGGDQAELLDRFEIETSVRETVFSQSEGSELLDRAVVDTVFRGTTIEVREFMAGEEATAMARRMSIEESSELLDTAEVAKINRVVVHAFRDYLEGTEASALFRSIVGGDVASLLDRFLVSKTNRNVAITAREYLASGDGVHVARPVATLGETGRLLDTGVVIKSARSTIVVTARELLRGSESAIQQRTRLFASAGETGRLLDRGLVSKFDRAVSVTAREFLRASETATENVTVIVPVASNIQAIWGAGNPECTWNTGAYAESCRVEYMEDESGVWFFGAVVNTSPNQFGYSYSRPSAASQIRFRVTPYTGDSATGNAGTTITSDVVSSGGPL